MVLVIISSGLPGSGKSTYLKRLSQEMPSSIYLDKDLVNKIFLSNHKMFSDFYTKHVKNQTYSLFYSLVLANKSSDVVFILDGFFGDKLMTAEFISFSQQVPVHIIHFSCSLSLVLSRLKERTEKRDEVLLASSNAFETLQKKESVHYENLKGKRFLEIDTENDIDDNMKTILDFISS